MIEHTNKYTTRYSLLNYGLVMSVSRGTNETVTDQSRMRIVSFYSKWMPWELTFSRPYATGRGEALANYLPRSLKDKPMG